MRQWTNLDQKTSLEPLRPGELKIMRISDYQFFNVKEIMNIE